MVLVCYVLSVVFKPVLAHLTVVMFLCWHRRLDFPASRRLLLFYLLKYILVKLGVDFCAVVDLVLLVVLPCELAYQEREAPRNTVIFSEAW